MFMNRVILVYSEKKKSIKTINSFPVFINFCTLQHKFFTYFTKGKKKSVLQMFPVNYYLDKKCKLMQRNS